MHSFLIPLLLVNRGISMDYESIKDTPPLLSVRTRIQINVQKYHKNKQRKKETLIASMLLG